MIPLTGVRSPEESRSQGQKADGEGPGLGEGRKELVLDRDRASVWEDGTVLEVDGGDSAVNILKAPELDT